MFTLYFFEIVGGFKEKNPTYRAFKTTIFESIDASSDSFTIVHAMLGPERRQFFERECVRLLVSAVSMIWAIQRFAATVVLCEGLIAEPVRSIPSRRLRNTKTMQNARRDG